MTSSCRIWLTMITDTLHGVWGTFVILAGCRCATPLVGTGRHEELIERCRIYRNLMHPTSSGKKVSDGSPP